MKKRITLRVDEDMQQWLEEASKDQYRTIPDLIHQYLKKIKDARMIDVDVCDDGCLCNKCT